MKVKVTTTRKWHIKSDDDEKDKDNDDDVGDDDGFDGGVGWL